MLSARPASTPAPAIQRDRFVWMAYLYMAHFTFAQAIFGPISPFLCDDLGLSYTVAALPFSALALAAAISGLSIDRLIARWGRSVVFWLGGIGISLGMVLIGLAQGPVPAIIGGGLIGALGSGGLVTVQAAISDRFAAQRTVVLTESTLAASFAASLAPLTVGGLEAVGAGWRWSLLGAAAAWGAALAYGWRARVPETPARAARQHPDTGEASPVRRHGSASLRRVLPGLFWLYMAVVLLLAAIQWSITLWGANFLRDEVGFNRVWASSLMWVYLTALVVARFVASRLARHYDSGRLLVVTILMAGAAFPVFWLAPWPALNVAAMLALGIGAGNFYPLGVALALGTTPDRADAASSRIVVGVGLSMLIVPQVLGALADQMGLMRAFGLLLVLLPLALALILVANRRAARQNGPSL